MLYVKAFDLRSLDAQLVFRTAMSQWAELHPLPGEAQAQVRPQPGTEPKARLTLARPEFGLRVMV